MPRLSAGCRAQATGLLPECSLLRTLGLSDLVKREVGRSREVYPWPKALQQLNEIRLQSSAEPEAAGLMAHLTDKETEARSSEATHGWSDTTQGQYLCLTARHLLGRRGDGERVKVTAVST